MVHKGGFNISKVPEDFVTHYLKKIGELPQELFLKLFQEMQEHEIQKYLPSIKTPTLVIGGDKDKVIPYYIQKYITKTMSNARLFTILDGSHVPQRDFPEIVNAQIIKFVKENA
jgi:pimeloyl-ACP methyl ester carboxylesterase